MSTPNTPQGDSRCNGRYPVGHKRQEPFEVTYRCEKREGHTGQCGAMDESAHKEMDRPRPRPTPGAWQDAHDALYEVIGQQHVLKHTLRFIRNWRADPNFNPDPEIERAEKAIEEWHRRFVDAVAKSDAMMVALSAQSESAPIAPTKEMIEAGRVAIMGMLEPKRTAMPKPSIAELEAILNADGDGRNINIELDGSVTELTPRTTTASEVAKTAYEAMVAAAPGATK